MQKEMQELNDNQRREIANRFDDLMTDNIRQADAQRQQPPVGHTQQIAIAAAELKRDFEAGQITAEDFERAMKILAYSA